MREHKKGSCDECQFYEAENLILRDMNGKLKEDLRQARLAEPWGHAHMESVTVNFIMNQLDMLKRIVQNSVRKPRQK